jgi:integrase
MARTIEATICKTTLEKTHIRKGEDEVWIKDTKISGYYVREKPQGARIFVFRYKKSGKNKSITIGIDGSDGDCEWARDKAEEMRKALRTKGDPRTALEKVKEQTITVEKAVNEYTEQIKAAKKLAPSTIAEYTRALKKKVVPILGDRHVSDIAFMHIDKLHTALANTPREANNVITVFKVFLNWCRRMGYRPQGLPSVTEGLGYYEENIRERTISPDELQRLLGSLNSLYREGMVSRHFYFIVWLMVLTGARVGQIKQLRWGQVDFEKGTIELKPKDTRKKRSRRRPKKDTRRLTGWTLKLMNELLETRDETCPWVFPAETQSGHFEAIKRPWSTLLKAAGISGLVRHDLRHHYATEALEAGIHPKVTSDITGHAQEVINQEFYQITRNEVARRAQVKLSKWIIKKGGAEPVVPPQTEASPGPKGDSADTEGPVPSSRIAKDGRRPMKPSRYPNKEVLQQMVNEKPVTVIAKELGLSDNAVARHCKKLGIVKPGRGDWTKMKAGIRINPAKNGHELGSQEKPGKPSAKTGSED